MNPPVPGIFPYVGRFPPWLDWWSTQFDFAWFFALLGWSLVLVIWWWQPRRSAPATPAWAWLPWSAAAGLLAGVTEFIVLNTPPMPVAKLTGDMVLGSLMLAAVAGWCWQAAQGRSRIVRILGALAVLPLALIAALRRDDPRLGGWLMVGAAILAIIPWWRARGMNAWSRTALVLAALIPLFSNVGPLALKWGAVPAQRDSQRRHAGGGRFPGAGGAGRPHRLRAGQPAFLPRRYAPQVLA